MPFSKVAFALAFLVSASAVLADSVPTFEQFVEGDSFEYLITTWWKFCHYNARLSNPVA